MGDKVELTLQDRSVIGKAVKKLRKEGYVPAVMYGQKVEPRAVMGSALEMSKAYRSVGRRHPLELHLGKEKRLAMIKTADFDPVKRTLRHLEFHVIKQNEKVQTEVPIVIEGTGETPAEKAGLVVLTTIDTVEVEALPGNLPDNLVLPGERLAEVGNHLSIADLVVPEHVTVLSDPAQVVATVYEPSALQAANEAAGGEAEVGDEEEVPSEEGGGEEGETEEVGKKEKGEAEPTPQ